MSNGLSDRGLRAAVAVAEERGLRFSRALVLRDLSNLLVHLAPAPVVARVSTATSIMRPGDGWLAREVAVAGHLAAAGAPVVAPSAEIAPGPHHHDGMVLTFWELAEEVPGVPDAAAAGRGLRACHEALREFRGDLHEHAGVREARAILERLAAAGAVDADDAAMLRRAGERIARRVDALALPLRPVHGDAHLGNVITTARGPLWIDWEDAFLGPVEWDLACLHASALVLGRDPAPAAAAQMAYGPAADPGALDVLIEARAFQVAVWTVVISAQRPGGAERIAARLAWLRERDRA